MATSVPGTSVPGKLGKGRNVCFTLNNYNDDDISKLRNVDCRYMVFGYEVGENGTPHLQGFVCWENPRSLDKFKDDVSQKLHLEKMRGTHKQASDYCKYADYPDNKVQNKFEEKGDLPVQGTRTDYALAIEQIKSGTPVEEVVCSQPQLLPGLRALERFKNLTLKPLNRDVKVIVLFGDAGTGKSKWAYDYDPQLYSKPDGEWWDGYDGQKTVLLDDFYGGILYPTFLKVLDRYPYNAPIKGGFLWAQWTTVIITSNKSPSDWYKHGFSPALRRRLHTVYKLMFGMEPKIISNEEVQTPNASSPQPSFEE